MFQDVSVGSLRFRSRDARTTAEASSQSVPIEFQDTESQTMGALADAVTQTDQKLTNGSSKNSKEAATSREGEGSAVRDMLDRVGPRMLHEMTKSSRTGGYFTSFERFLEASQEKSISKLFALTFDYDAYFQARLPTTSDKHSVVDDTTSSSLKLSVTGVSWNSTGSVIAVSYGRFDHTGWCNYRSALCLWSVFQPDFQAHKPSTVLETSSGLMCVAWHPKNPSLVAAGTFNGEVFVWDLEPEEYKFYASGIGDYFHREPVTQVAWVYDANSGEYNVASVSGDGKVLFWRLKDKLSYPIEGYVMHLPSPDRGNNQDEERSTIAPHGRVGGVTKTPVIGGKALAFNLQDKTSRSFVVGSEGGAIIRCFTKGTARSADFKGDKKWTATAARLLGKLPPPRLAAARRQVEAHATEKKSKEITLAMVYDAKIDPQALYPSAVDFVYEQHGGPVYDISFSPFRKSLFFTCSSDGTARLYSYLQQEPILSLDVAPSTSYLYAVEWSKTRPMVLAVAAEDGNVYLYDLKLDRVKPAVVLSGSDPATTAGDIKGYLATKANTSSASPMFAVDFNPRQRNFLAAGDANGIVHIWKLSWQFANLQSGEMELLEAIEKQEK